MSEAMVTVRVHIRLFLWWVLFCQAISVVIGEHRAENLAYSGRWLVLVKVGNGRWRFLRDTEDEP